MDVIIETPRGSTVKYKYEEEYNMFRLLKRLPAGLAFPYDFGFFPNTKGEDEDPLDVMVLSEFTAFTGCVMDCRVIGCLEVEQKKGNNFIRNDRFLAVPELSDQYSQVSSISDAPETLVTEIETFFKTYLEREGKEFRTGTRMNAALAMEKLISLK